MRRPITLALGLLLLAAAAGCAAPPPPAPPLFTETKRELMGRWQSEARTTRVGGEVARLHGGDGRVVGQELVFLADGQLVIESQLDGAVDLDVSTGTWDVASENLLLICRFPRKGRDPLPQQELRYTFYFDRGELILNRDQEKLVFKKVASPEGTPPAAPPPPAPVPSRAASAAPAAMESTVPAGQPK